MCMLDDILSKIKVPFQLLHINLDILQSEKRILLNIYCSEITHALRCVEALDVPRRRVRAALEVPR